ncbi:hypothetical protein HK102_007745, partial [Quaeritorhiza haematococci]
MTDFLPPTDWGSDSLWNLGFGFGFDTSSRIVKGTNKGTGFPGASSLDSSPWREEEVEGGSVMEEDEEEG